MRRRILGGALLATAALAPWAAAATPGTPSAARLGGEFSLEGKVTAAVNVAGEHAGEVALRAWRFTPLCNRGACAKVKLVRHKPRGSDSVTLHRTSAGHYAGSGRFYAALKCGRRTYAKGEQVPFTITVHVTGAQVIAGVDTATRVRATYTSRSRKNLTPCVIAPSHDSASYHGHLVTSAPSGPGTPGAE
jgi:hypothetical protein